MPLEKLLLNFQQFLSSSWVQLNKVMEFIDWDNDPYFIDTWMQANWELLVEQQLEGDIKLPSYGYDSSSKARYTNIGIKPSHHIVCELKGVTAPQKFLCFTSKNDSEVSLKPPFNTVSVKCIKTNKISYLPLKEVEFSLIEN